jgi:predicted naringenin-chalcone synthase
MTIQIAGLGLALPEHSIAQHEAAQFALASCVATDKQRQLAPKLYQRSGVESRHSVLLTASTNGQPAEQAYYEPPSDLRPYGPSTAQRMMVYREQAGDLATRAAEQALDTSCTPADSITHLVTVSCSGFYAPSFDVQMINRLGLSPKVPRTHVGFMGCHGALNGLRVAKAFAAADPSARVLLVAVELCSLHYQYEWTNERIVSNSLFADGAASLVVRNEANALSPWNVYDDFAEIVPDSEDAMSWAIGDHGFQMTLSAAVPELIRQELRGRMEGWLRQNRLAISDIAGWAIHPGGPRILHACQEALQLPDTALAASHETLRQYGNMSSPTVLFVLDKLRDATPGPVVMLGFGPGLAIEACLLMPSEASNELR